MTRRRTTVDGQPGLPLDAELSNEQRSRIASHIEPGWQKRAACIGREADMWFPEDGEEVTGRTAARVCSACPVAESCRAAGILGDEAGIWGGATQDQRRVLAERISYGATVLHVLDRLHRLPPIADPFDQDEGVAA